MAAQIREWRQRRDQRIEWQNELIDAPVERVRIVVPPRGDAHSEILLDALECRTKVALLDPRARGALGIEPAMQQRCMGGVDLTLHCLQPVALLNTHGDMHLLRWHEIA